MPRDKDVHNKSHQSKLSYHYVGGRSFVDNRIQQERLAKFQQQQEKKRIKEENRFRAQQEARQEAQQQRAARHEEIFGEIFGRWPDVFVPNFDRHQEENNRPFIERDNPVDQDNRFNPAHFGL